MSETEGKANLTCLLALATCEATALEAENAKLLEQGVRLFDKTLDLAAENTKLRAQLAEWKRVAESKQDIIDHMRDANAENAKLRELVKDMWPHVRHRSRMCGECELPCDTSDECLLYEPMRQRMSELGVEVDE